MKPILTRDLAWAAAKDAATANMRHNGRKHWNQDDYNTAAETFERLWPVEADILECVRTQECESHHSGCICADCSGAELTAEND